MTSSIIRTLLNRYSDFSSSERARPLLGCFWGAWRGTCLEVIIGHAHLYFLNGVPPLPHYQTQTLIVVHNPPRHGRQFLSQWLIIPLGIVGRFSPNGSEIPSKWLKNPLIMAHNSPFCGSKIPSTWLKNPPQKTTTSGTTFVR